jgi:predicted nucleic acid-binding protein
LIYYTFDKIYIAQAVYEEAVVFGQEAGGAKREVCNASWIETRIVNDRLTVKTLLNGLDIGEAETIVLAREMGADWVLMDERKGRRKLTQWGLNKIGTIGILLKAKQVGLLSLIRPDIEQLHQQGFSLSQTVVNSVLQQANEPTN